MKGKPHSEKLVLPGLTVEAVQTYLTMRFKEGQIEEGLATQTKAFDIVHSTDEHLYEPELYRIKGELLLAQEVKSQNAL